MKPLLPLLFFALFTGAANAQQLNEYGHLSFESGGQKSEKQVTVKNGLYKVKAGALELDGNACFATTSGYVTVLSVYETLPTTLRHYSLSGELLFSKDYKQVLNLSVADDGSLAI